MARPPLPCELCKAEPEPRGEEVEIRLHVDSADHAGDQLVNSAPLIWFFKRQPTVETSVFGAESVTMKNGMEAEAQTWHDGCSSQWTGFCLW